MTARICTFLLLVTACQLDPKTIGDPTGDASDSSDSSASDSATSEPLTTSQGSTSEPATTDGSSTGTSEPGTTTVGTSMTGGPPPVMCEDGPENFPAFPKACQTADDCAIGYHAIDCCGSLLAIGIQIGDELNFMEAEALCQSQYPQCDCAPKLTIAEDGATQTEGLQVGVACQDMLCQTFIEDPCAGIDLPACPGECPPDNFPDSCGMPCDVEGAACGNNIGDGMVCTGGIWACTVHPPLGEGCNLVCK